CPSTRRSTFSPNTCLRPSTRQAPTDSFSANKMRQPRAAASRLHFAPAQPRGTKSHALFLHALVAFAPIFRPGLTLRDLPGGLCLAPLLAASALALDHRLSARLALRLAASSRRRRSSRCRCSRCRCSCLRAAGFRLTLGNPVFAFQPFLF